MIKNLALAAAVAVSLSLVACTSETSGSSQQGKQGSASTSQTAGSEGGATCDSACTYYLQCKGADSSHQADCVAACQNQGYTSDQLASFEQMDCASAVAAIEGPSSGQQQGGSGSASGAPDCYKCQWDGESCIYTPGIGAYSTCDPSCCK